MGKRHEHIPEVVLEYKFDRFHGSKLARVYELLVPYKRGKLNDTVKLGTTMALRRAVIYARVSSERQREAQTISSQTAAVQEFARKEGYAIADEWIFEDEGYSGSTLVRPGLERVRDMAADGQIDTVLVYSPDRLSRKYAYQVLLMEEFLRNGVEVVFVNAPQAHTPEEQLLVQFQGMIAEYERAQIAERSRRGKRYRARSGIVNVLSGAPYGYRYVKKTDDAAAYYEVIEAEAEVVRMIYDLYSTGRMSMGAITRLLNDRGIPTRKGVSRWERSTVWGILRNPAYVGKACFGKTKQTTRRKVTRKLRLRGGHSPRCSSSDIPRAEWIEIAVPALIAEDVDALAQEKLAENKRFAARQTKEPTLLQGMLVCRKCGYAYYRASSRTSLKKIHYYRCLGSDHFRYPDGRNLDEVYYRLARIYEVDSPYRDIESARYYYSLIYELYPESLYSSAAAERHNYLDRYFFLVQ